jgi:hypothetical protein
MLSFFQKIWDKVLIAGGVLSVLLPVSPLNMPFPFRDSGVFLYIGWRIISGDIPYRDVWDHKPPVIFYLNALGLTISGGSRWGIWVIEFISLTTAAFISYKLLGKAFGRAASLFSLLIWLLSLNFILLGGNLTTEYTLPLQFACLWLACTSGTKNRASWRYYLIGLLGGVIFFTKQTAVGIDFAIVLFIIIERLRAHQTRELLADLSSILLGVGTITVLIMLFFLQNGALKQFGDAAFVYNLVASSSGSIAERISGFLVGVQSLAHTGFAQFGLAGYCIFVIRLFSRKKSLAAIQARLLSIGLIDLVIESILLNVKGALLHYFITLLPALAIGAGLLFWTLVETLQDISISKWATTVLSIVTISCFYGAVSWDYHHLIVELHTHRPIFGSIVSYIDKHTTDDDYVLMLGAETTVNFLSKRQSPTRFVYQYPLYESGYTSEQMVMEFINGIIEHEPLLAVPKKMSKLQLGFPVDSEEIRNGIEYVKVHYKAREKLDNWTVFEFTK